MIDLNYRGILGTEKIEKNHKRNFKYILKGVVICFVITMILLVFLSAILTYTAVSENICNIAIIVITGMSILIGSSITNLNIGKKGIVNGTIIGGIYIGVLYILSSLATGDFSIGTNSIIMIVIGCVCGTFGGIFGVNLNKKNP